jgi:hypothetical protein
MFTQDIPLGVMPYRSSRNAELKIGIDGTATNVSDALSVLESLSRDSGYGDTQETISDAIREVAQELAWHGMVPYEIWRSDDEHSEIKFALSPFTARRLVRMPKHYLQIVPRADRRHWGRSIIVLPRDSIWLVSMPKEFGGHRGYRRTLRQLARFNWTAPDFWQSDLHSGRMHTQPSFDFSEYRRQIDIYRDRVTRTWGWSGRDTTLEKRTEFALLYRIMTFRWSQAVLREHIIDQLNALFERLNLVAKIHVVGLQTAADILKLRGAMSEGSVPYAKAFEDTD